MDMLTVEDGNVHVAIPMYFRRVAGTKKMVLDDQLRVVDATTLSSDPILVAYARARAYLKLLDKGQHRTVTELGESFGIDRANFGRDLALAMLSPRIIQSVMQGTAPAGLSVNRLRMLSTENWEEQERQVGLAHDS